MLKYQNCIKGNKLNFQDRKFKILFSLYYCMYNNSILHTRTRANSEAFSTEVKFNGDRKAVFGPCDER